MRKSAGDAHGLEFKKDFTIVSMAHSPGNTETFETSLKATPGSDPAVSGRSRPLAV
jgi:hypothetical protein